KRIDLDARDAELRHVAELLADVGEVSIVIPDDVKGKVTVLLKNVPWDEALQQVLASKGYAFDRKDEILTVRAGPPSPSPAPAPPPPRPAPAPAPPPPPAPAP